MSTLWLLGLAALVALLIWWRRPTTTEPSLYTRLGGIFPIAAVVNTFSDRLLDNPLVGRASPNPQLRDWSTNKAATRLPGLKWMRTLWLANVAGGPYRFEPSANCCPFTQSQRLNLTQAHCPYRITSAEFDAVAQELATTLDLYAVPEREKMEVLNAFAAHKQEVITGSTGQCIA